MAPKMQCDGLPKIEFTYLYVNCSVMHLCLYTHTSLSIFRSDCKTGVNLISHTRNMRFHAHDLDVLQDVAQLGAKDRHTLALCATPFH